MNSSDAATIFAPEKEGRPNVRCPGCGVIAGRPHRKGCAEDRPAASARAAICVLAAYMLGVLVMATGWQLQSAWFVLPALGGGVLAVTLAVVGASR